MAKIFIILGFFSNGWSILEFLSSFFTFQIYQASWRYSYQTRKFHFLFSTCDFNRSQYSTDPDLIVLFSPIARLLKIFTCDNISL